MNRRHWVELHDLAFCPAAIRDGLTDFLETSIEFADIYGPIRSILFESITKSKAERVVDLCSGAGGPWAIWRRQGLTQLDITLTDKFPNGSARQRLKNDPLPGLRYAGQSVDAAQVPAGLTGFRTIFSAFHHFAPDHAREILRSAIASRQPIGIFEFTYRSRSEILGMLRTPLAVWYLTPRMQARGWTKLLLTYLLPLIPLVAMIDGIVSCWRTYKISELQLMVSDTREYKWVSGVQKTAGSPFQISYFIGYPVQGSGSDSSTILAARSTPPASSIDLLKDSALIR
jgi:hypothetical protein